MTLFTRKELMDKKVGHNDYYSQFVNPHVIDYVAARIGRERIVKSDDKHFNDIPLSLWDGLTDIKNIIDREKFKQANNVTYAEEHRNSFLWSLSNQVCIAKQAARMVRQYENSEYEK